MKSLNEIFLCFLKTKTDLFFQDIVFVALDIVQLLCDPFH